MSSKSKIAMLSEIERFIELWQAEESLWNTFRTNIKFLQHS